MPEEVTVNKISGFHECIICHYWYFLELNFRFQPKVCDGCHDLMQKAKSFNDAATISVNPTQDGREDPPTPVFSL